MMSNSEAKLYIPCDDKRMGHSTSASIGKSWVASQGRGAHAHGLQAAFLFLAPEAEPDRTVSRRL